MKELHNRIDAGGQRLLNLGCGNSFHDSWTNIDLVACDPRVIQHDLTRGISFPDNWFDAVYHSHVLEHLTPDDAQRFIRECRRVLKPSGTLRIVVPDLEGIARSYLDALQRAESGDDLWIANHRWMQLELIDQLVRTHSGGEMGPYMAQAGLPNEDFLRLRMGDEFLKCRSSLDEKIPSNVKLAKPIWLKRNAMKIRDKVTRLFLKVLYGKAAYQQFLEARFRGQGEIHRWMYDRISLCELLSNEGFENVQSTQADSSMILNFASYELDSKNSVTRKPDSLFVEGRKLAESVRAVA